MTRSQFTWLDRVCAEDQEITRLTRMISRMINPSLASKRAFHADHCGAETTLGQSGSHRSLRETGVAGTRRNLPPAGARRRQEIFSALHGFLATRRLPRPNQHPLSWRPVRLPGAVAVSPKIPAVSTTVRNSRNRGFSQLRHAWPRSRVACDSRASIPSENSWRRLAGFVSWLGRCMRPRLSARI